MTQAISTYATAKGYVQSIMLQMSNPLRYSVDDDGSFALSFHLISGFAMELYLKAYLYAQGHTEKELKAARLRHDLEALRAMTIPYGFISDDADMLVDLLHRHHKSFEFRYTRQDSIFSLKPIDEIFLAFSAVDFIVDTIVGASTSKGLKPGGMWAFPHDKAFWRMG